jgi:hypothetical protein
MIACGLQICRALARATQRAQLSLHPLPWLTRLWQRGAKDIFHSAVTTAACWGVLIGTLC